MADRSTTGAPDHRRRDATDPTRVALIASDSLYRDALEAWLRGQIWIELIAVAPREDGAGRLLANRPDIVILEDRAALQHLAAEVPDACFIFMKLPKTVAEADELMRQGVAAFISPDWNQTRLDLALTAIRTGHVVLPSSLTVLGYADNAETDSRPKPHLSSLTNRQTEVLVLLARGLTNKQIGKELNIAESTVKTHVHSILGRLGVDRRGQAAALYLNRDPDSVT